MELKRYSEEFGDFLSRKQFKTSDLGISSRQLNYWKARKIVPFIEKDKKGNMPLSEALWLLIINELSYVGIDTKKLEALSYKTWLKPFYEKYADEIFRQHLNSAELDDDMKGFLKHCLDFENIMNDCFRRIINPFTDVIKKSLTREGVVASLIYCPKTEEYIYAYGNSQIPTNLNALLYQETLITVPLLPHLAKLVGFDLSKQKEDLNYLSQVENQIRRLVFFDKPKKLEVSVNEKGKEKIHVITEAHKNPEQLAKFFLETKLPLGSKITIDPRPQGNFKVTIKS